MDAQTEVRNFINEKPEQQKIFRDCNSIDQCMWTRVMMTSIMSYFRPIKGGKPFNISVIQDGLAAQVSEKEAISLATSLCDSLIDQSKHSEQTPDNQGVMQSLDRLGRILKERTVGSRGLNETHAHIKQKQHGALMIKSPPEALLGQDWVNRQVCPCWPL